jgi:20S proteasome subunit alpha 7
VFQVEYAAKAVENSGTVVALVCKDGVVMVVEKLILSKMLEDGSNKRIFTPDSHVGVAVAGLTADGRRFAKKVAQECRSYERQYGAKIPAKALGSRAGNHAQFYTQFSHLRPYGVSTLIAVKDAGKPQLLMIEPSGLWYGYRGASIGKGRQSAQTEIEKLDLENLLCKDALKEAANM